MHPNLTPYDQIPAVSKIKWYIEIIKIQEK